MKKIRRFLNVGICTWVGLCLALCSKCSIDTNIAGGSEIGNPVLIGTIVDTLGMPAADARIRLVPINYNPVEMGDLADSLVDTADGNGAYSFKGITPGIYNLHAFDNRTKKQTLHSFIMITKQTKKLVDTLNETGIAKVRLPKNAEIGEGYLYIPGTMLYKELHNANIITDNDKSYAVFDSLPSDILPGIYYGEKDISFIPFSLKDSVPILPNDTVVINTIDVEKGNILGIVTNEEESPVRDVVVYALPQTSNPLYDTSMFYDTTNFSGMYEIDMVDSGIYTIAGYHIYSGARFIVTDIAVHTSAVAVQTKKLLTPGAVALTLPDTVDTVNGYVYIPGTRQYQLLKHEALFYDVGRIHMVFDSLPCGRLPGIYYGVQGSSVSPLCLIDSVTVNENDTTDVRIRDIWTVYNTVSSSIPSNDLYSVIVDHDNVLWALTAKNSVTTFNGSAWQEYTAQNSKLPLSKINTIVQSSDQTIWIGTQMGLVKIKNDQWTVYDSALPNSSITDITFDNNNMLWYCTFNGCVEYTGTDWVFHNGGDAAKIMSFNNSICFDRNNNPFVGGANGLFTRNAAQWAVITIPVLPENDQEVYDITIDVNNTIWLATDRGIVYKTHDQWGIYNVSNSGLPSDAIQCIAKDTKGNIWAGTQIPGAIIKINMITNRAIAYTGNNTPALANCGTVNDIFADKDNSLYFATSNAGILQLKTVHLN